MITFYDGPKTYYTIAKAALTHSHIRQINRLDMNTIYFSSMIDLEVFENSPYNNQTALVVIFRKITCETRASNNSKSIQIISGNAYPLHELHTIQPDNGIFLSISFQIRKFRGWTWGNCYYGGYTVMEYKSFTTKFNIFEHGPYCNTSQSNYPLISDSGLQKLVFGSQKIVLLFYAYSPLYEIDLDIIIQQSRCEGILNPIAFCNHHYVIRSGASTTETFVKHTNYLVFCLRHPNSAYIRVILGTVCIIVQQTHMREWLDYNLEIAGSANIQVTYSLPFIYNTLYLFDNYSYVAFTIRLSNYTTHTLKLKSVSINSLPYEDAISTQIRCKHINWSYHQPSYATLFEHHLPGSTACVNGNSSYHRKLSEETMHLKLTSNCGTFIYKEQKTYMFTLAQYKLAKLNELYKIKYYLSFIYTDACFISEGLRDQLSLCLSSYIAQSMILNQSEMHVVTHDVSVKIIYYKYSNPNCTTFKIVFHRQQHQLLSEIRFLKGVVIKVRQYIIHIDI